MTVQATTNITTTPVDTTVTNAGTTGTTTTTTANVAADTMTGTTTTETFDSDTWLDFEDIFVNSGPYCPLTINDAEPFECDGTECFVCTPIQAERGADAQEWTARILERHTRIMTRQAEALERIADVLERKL